MTNIKNKIIPIVLAVLVTMAFWPAFSGTDRAAAEEAASDTSGQTEQSQTEPQQNEDVKTGWVTNDDGTKSYYNNEGKAVKGLVTIEGSKYYFDSKGIMKTGYVNTGSGYYYFAKNGKGSKKGWIAKKKYYSLGNGKLAAGKKKIGKNNYFFNSKGVRKTSKGFASYNGSKYYVTGKSGKLATGWQAIYTKKTGKHAYYFSKKSAKMATNTKVGYLKIPKNGKLGKAYYYGVKRLHKLGIKNIKRNEKSLRKAYDFSRELKYIHTEKSSGYRPKTSEKAALHGLYKSKNITNCFVKSGTFFVLAKILGYNVKHAYGTVNKGLDHAWTEIVYKKGKSKKVYVFDPTKDNSNGMIYFKVKYRQPGTWKYYKDGYVKSSVK